MIYDNDSPDTPTWALELVHTKAVRGTSKTNQRRPYRNGLKSMGKMWATCRPTLDALWMRPWARRFDLNQRRAARTCGAMMKGSA